MSVASSTEQSFSRTIEVRETPAQAFAAITNIRGWWSAEVVGDSEKLGDVFIFDVPGVHRCRMEITQLIPDQRVVWHVSESYISFIEDKTEWDGTDVVFDVSEVDGKTEIRFTHVGLVPAVECFEICTDAWGSYISGSLRSLIETGQGDPHRAESTFESELQKHDANKPKQ